MEVFFFCLWHWSSESEAHIVQLSAGFRLSFVLQNCQTVFEIAQNQINKPPDWRTFFYTHSFHSANESIRKNYWYSCHRKRNFQLFPLNIVLKAFPEPWILEVSNLYFVSKINIFIEKKHDRNLSARNTRANQTRQGRKLNENVWNTTNTIRNSKVNKGGLNPNLLLLSLSSILVNIHASSRYGNKCMY